MARGVRASRNQGRNPDIWAVLLGYGCIVVPLKVTTRCSGGHAEYTEPILYKYMSKGGEMIAEETAV